MNRARAPAASRKVANPFGCVASPRMAKATASPAGDQSVSSSWAGPDVHCCLPGTIGVDGVDVTIAGWSEWKTSRLPSGDHLAL